MFLKLASPVFLIFALFFLFGAGLLHSQLNGAGAEDVKTTGIVVFKEHISVRGKANNRSRTRIQRYLSIIYKVEIDSYQNNKIREMVEKRQIENFEIKNVEIRKNVKRIEDWLTENNYPLENYVYEKIPVSRSNYSTVNLDDQIPVFFRSDRPWDISLSLDADRTAITFFLSMGIFSFVFSIIGFYIIYFRRGPGGIADGVFKKRV